MLPLKNDDEMNEEEDKREKKLKLYVHLLVMYVRDRYNNILMSTTSNL